MSDPDSRASSADEALSQDADFTADSAGGMDQTEQLRLELSEARDRELRARAEIENTRRRMRRETDEQLRYATQPLLADLLAVVDNIERAIEAGKKSADATSLLEGVQIVATQLETVLAKHGCRRIPATGQSFDPNLHAAIMQQPSADHPAGTILIEAQPGYTLHDRVVRPSQVVVSAAKE